MRKAWDKIINVGYLKGLSEQEIKRLHLINSTSFLCIIFTAFALFINAVFENTVLIWTCIITILGFGTAVFLNYKHKFISATFAYLICPFYFAFTTVYAYGNAMEIEYIFLLVPIVGLMLFEETIHQVFLFVISVISLLVLKSMYLFHNPLFEPQFKLVLELTAAISCIVIGFLVMKLFQKDTIESRNQTKKALADLQKMNEELTKKEQALTRKNAELKEQIELKEDALSAKNESDRRYRVLFENGFDGILIYDINNLKTVGCNKKMLEFFETDLADLKQASLFDFLEREQPSGPLTESLIKEKQKLIRETGKFSFMALFNTRKEKQLAGQVTAVLSPPPNEHLAVAIFKNVTSQWHANEKIMAANKELTNFAHAASHDLREPLRMIHSFGQLLERRNKEVLDETGQEFLDYIIEASERMTTLVNDLLNYATTGADLNEVQAIDLNDLIFSINNNLRLKIQETGATVTANNLPKIKGHPTLITQLFQNIISNCLKFRKKKIAPKIRISSKEFPRHYEFSVADNGIGIAPENQDRIFEVFRRLHSKQEYEGSGIGLATCKKILDKYGGNIWVESELGVGTTFIFSIPKETRETKVVQMDRKLKVV